jgi:hypothetical protein
MPSFTVRYRGTTGWKEQVVEATSRDTAIHQVIDAAPEDMEVEVSNVVESDVQAEPKHAAPAAKKEDPHAKK